MDPDTDSLVDILLPPATTAGRTLGKFRPKTRPETVKPSPAPTKLPDATQLIPPTLELPLHAPDLKCPVEKSNLPTSCIDGSFTNVSDPDVTQESVNQPEFSHSETLGGSQSEPLVTDGDNVVALQCDQGEPGEITDMFFSMESLDFTQPPSISVRAVGRFQPKTKAQSKGKTLLTTYTAVHDGVKSVGASEFHVSQEPCCLSEEKVDQVMTVCSGLESLDDGIFQSGTTAEQAHGKFRPKLRPKTEKQISASSNSAGATQLISPTLEPHLHASLMRCPEKGHSLPTTSTAGSSIIGTCTSDLHISLESVNQLEASLSEDLVLDGADMFSNMEPLHDNQPALTSGVGESPSASNNSSSGEEVPKQNWTPRKSRKQMIENEKTVWKRKRASEVPSSSVQEPVKKKFPHATQRKRRQVNKVSLETPEDDIDQKQLSLKDLIMLPEAEDRILNNESAALRKSSPKQSSSSLQNGTHFNEDNPFADEQYLNFDGDEAKRDIEPTNLNYHSFKKRPSAKWSKSETELFYQAISQFGTDFAMIQKLFPQRTDRQIRLYFKNEEIRHPMQLNDALNHRSRGFSNSKFS